METKSYSVTGMHCASCAAIIAKKLSKIEGVTDVAVNLVTETAKVSTDQNSISTERLNETLNKYGYGLVEELPDTQVVMNEERARKKAERENELREQKKSIIFSFSAALSVFFLMMWELLVMVTGSVPAIPINKQILDVCMMLLSTWMLFKTGSRFQHGILMFIRSGAASMDTLIGIGTLSAYVYSSLILFVPGVRNFLHASSATYFDVTIVVTGFVLFGKYLETRSKLKTGAALEKLMNLQAKTALVKRNGKETEIPVEAVRKGDHLLVKPGQSIPVDGIILEGSSSIDEAMISGEPLPVDRKVGDRVIGGTLNRQGRLTIEASAVGRDTMLAKIISMVEEAQGSKAPIQQLADKVASVFVPVVLILSLLTVLIWLTIGSWYLGFTTALSYGIICFVGILVIACPCALGLATPTAMIVGICKGAEHGILIRDAESLEKLGTVDTVVMDKTGTITAGNPYVCETLSFDPELTPHSLLQLAATLEFFSEHPLATAIVTAAGRESLHPDSVSDFRALEGIGVRATLDNRIITVRKPDSAEQNMPMISPSMSKGNSVVLIEIDGALKGLITLEDTLKAGVVESVATLRHQNIDVIMLTGDNEASAQKIASQAGITTVYSELLPQDKARLIREFQQKGKRVVMAGDGINDAPALAQADVGIAMATGTDIAIESAGITLLHGDIARIALAISLSRATMRIIRQNLFWAFIYNVIGIPLAAGALFPLTGIILNPVFSGMAMAGSSVSVVSNSLRLKRFR